MANMGTTGTINITKDMMDKAITAIDTYQTTITNLNTELLAEIDGIILHPFLVQQLLDLRHFILRILNLIRVKI